MFIDNSRCLDYLIWTARLVDCLADGEVKGLNAKWGYIA